MEQNERQAHTASSLPSSNSPSGTEPNAYTSTTFSALGMLPRNADPTNPFALAHSQPSHTMTPAPFQYPPSSVIRFACSNVSHRPESLEHFDFGSLPSSHSDRSKEQLQPQAVIDTSSIHTSSGVNEAIPHSSGMTTLSNITSDDSTTLIGQGRSNTIPPPLPKQHQQQQKQQQKQQEEQQHHQEEQKQQQKQEEEEEEQKQKPSSPRPLSNDLRASARQSISISTQEIDNLAGPSTPVIPLETLPRRSGIGDLSRKPTVRNYQVFPGRNKFFCGGRFITSREYWAFLLALILLIAPSVLFGIFTCPFIWEHVHPVIPIVFAYLFVLSLASMIKTSWTDPGIIPRDLDPFPMLDQPLDDQSSAYGSVWHHGIPSQKQVQIKDSTWTLRYCETCRIYRPPRASHCRQCDNCVEVEDHHCIWLNNCIGKRNYRPFFVFITTASLLCLFVIVFSIVHVLLIYKSYGFDASFNTIFSEAPVSFVLAIVCFVLLIMIGGLTLYHCSLILRGITTHEQLRASLMNTKYPSANPYNKGNPLLNMAQVLCRPRPKSYLRRRKFAEPEKLYPDQKPV